MGFSPWGRKESDTTKVTLCTEAKFFACSISAPVGVEHEDGVAAWLAGTLQCQVCRDKDCLHRRSYDPIRVFF